ncbi:transporter substrate-binding domain-containing protein [Frigidibacter sp. MR17.14]|uniref:transporter substrate-binding domain-containing protein n=1 Tax=Frigidibacter sp. MR17.14 TaxID=3126509 RepID=UPI0030131705
MDRKTFLRGAAALGAGALALQNAVITPAAAQTSDAAGSSRFDAARERGKLLVATMTTIPPFASKSDTGALEGFDIDIARIAAKAMFEDPEAIEFVGVSGDGRWPAILTGQADFGLATTYMSRANTVGFTAPYLDTSITLLASKKSGLKTLDDVNNADVTVANLSNPQMADRAKQYFPNAQTSIFDGISAQFLALRSGRAQAMQIDKPVADYYAVMNGDEVVVLDATLGVIFGNGLFYNPTDARWGLWLDTFVRELKSGTLYPDYTAAFQKWFGTNPPPQRFYG